MDLGTLWFLALQLGDLVCQLDFVVPRRLDALLHIPNMLQDSSAIIKVVCIEVLLLTDLRQQHADLVGELANCIISGCFTPLGDLGRDGDALLAGGFVGLDQVVFRLDQAVQFSAQFWLDLASERVEAERVAFAVALAVALVGADGEGSIPKKKRALAFCDFRCSERSVLELMV